MQNLILYSFIFFLTLLSTAQQLFGMYELPTDLQMTNDCFDWMNVWMYDWMNKLPTTEHPQPTSKLQELDWLYECMEGWNVNNIFV